MSSAQPPRLPAAPPTTTHHPAPTTDPSLPPASAPAAKTTTTPASRGATLTAAQFELLRARVLEWKQNAPRLKEAEARVREARKVQAQLAREIAEVMSASPILRTEGIRLGQEGSRLCLETKSPQVQLSAKFLRSQLQVLMPDTPEMALQLAQQLLAARPRKERQRLRILAPPAPTETEDPREAGEEEAARRRPTKRRRATPGAAPSGEDAPPPLR